MNIDLIPTPQKVSMPRNIDSRKHCRYYCNFGHTTLESLALKDKIEELIQAWELRRFVHQHHRPSSSRWREERYRLDFEKRNAQVELSSR